MILLRSGLFNLFFFSATFVLTLSGVVLRLFSRELVMGVAMLWGRSMVAAARVLCGIRLELSGRALLPSSGSALIASRHQSAFDTMVWLTLLPRCCYVLKQELLGIPLLGTLIKDTGMIAIDRQGGAGALRHLLREADRAVREGRQIVIFPEGTRGEPGTTLPLQPGIAALAARTGLPVIPVITDSGQCWGRRAFNKRPGVIHIQVLTPIPAGTPRDELMRQLTQRLGGDLTWSEPVDNVVG